MRFTLNRWQIWLLFSPLFLITIARTLHLEIYSPYFKNNPGIFRSIYLLNGCLIAWYQSYLVIGFLNYVKSKSLLIKLNTLVAPVSFTFVCCISFFKTFVQPNLFEVNELGQPIAPSMGVSGWTLFFLLALSLINFMYINYKVVTNRVALLRDIEDQLYAKFNFTEPLKNLLSATYGVIAIAYAISLAIKFITKV